MSYIAEEKLRKYFRFKLRDGHGFDVHEPEDAWWSINRFPDGQIQFWMEEAYAKEVVGLTCCLCTAEHVEVACQILSCIELEEGVKITYLYGARSDKSRAGTRVVANVARLTGVMLREATFEGNGVSAFELNLDIVAPHSGDAMPTLYEALWPMHEELLRNEGAGKYDTWLFPDQSAIVRYGHLIPGGMDCVVCEKVRDQVSGDIVKHEISLPSGKELGKVLIVDDLCDGGRTYLDLLRMPNAVQREVKGVDLYVTHGLFSNDALIRLGKAGIGTVWTTNSLPEGGWQAKGWGAPNVNVMDVWAWD